jgi:hypothetical protein
MSIKRYIVLVFASVMAIGVGAQNATSSPSSRFGYGELNDNLPSAYRAMGGVGIGMRSNKAINSAQPASYTACDSMTFMFDIAGSFLYTNYGDSYGMRNRLNGNLEYVTVQFPIWRQHIAFSAGVTPYSASGYNFSLSDSVNSDYHYTHTYSGEGGFTQVYGGLSFNICNWVALGANVYYMFGDITKSRTQSFLEADVMGATQTDYLKINSLRLRYGIQFFHTFGKHTIVLGGVFENKQRFSRSEYMQVEITSNDTVETLQNAFEMPLMYGAGISYNYANRLTIALDYQCQDWTDVLFFDKNNVLRARERWMMGLEYRHDPTSRTYAHRICWRLGANYTTSYSMNTSMPEIGASIGIGFPLRTVGTVINTTFEYVHRGSMNTNEALQENSLRFIVNATIAENWFFKRKL